MTEIETQGSLTSELFAEAGEARLHPSAEIWGLLVEDHPDYVGSLSNEQITEIVDFSSELALLIDEIDSGATLEFKLPEQILALHGNEVAMNEEPVHKRPARVAEVIADVVTEYIHRHLDSEGRTDKDFYFMRSALDTILNTAFTEALPMSSSHVNRLEERVGAPGQHMRERSMAETAAERDREARDSMRQAWSSLWDKVIGKPLTVAERFAEEQKADQSIMQERLSQWKNKEALNELVNEFFAKVGQEQGVKITAELVEEVRDELSSEMGGIDPRFSTIIGVTALLLVLAACSPNVTIRASVEPTDSVVFEEVEPTAVVEPTIVPTVAPTAEPATPAAEASPTPVFTSSNSEDLPTPEVVDLQEKIVDLGVAESTRIEIHVINRVPIAEITEGLVNGVENDSVYPVGTHIMLSPLPGHEGSLLFFSKKSGLSVLEDQLGGLTVDDVMVGLDTQTGLPLLMDNEGNVLAIVMTVDNNPDLAPWVPQSVIAVSNIHAGEGWKLLEQKEEYQVDGIQVDFVITDMQGNELAIRVGGEWQVSEAIRVEVDSEEAFNQMVMAIVDAADVSIEIGESYSEGSRFTPGGRNFVIEMVDKEGFEKDFVTLHLMNTIELLKLGREQWPRILEVNSDLENYENIWNNPEYESDSDRIRALGSEIIATRSFYAPMPTWDVEENTVALPGDNPDEIKIYMTKFPLSMQVEVVSDIWNPNNAAEFRPGDFGVGEFDESFFFHTAGPMTQRDEYGNMRIWVLWNSDPLTIKKNIEAAFKYPVWLARYLLFVDPNAFVGPALVQGPYYNEMLDEAYFGGLKVGRVN